ncbi:hypothetical protein SSX86_001862 [Deinandra increscens subsp. villosa]|uniref:Uncharacterized protein n=1 Tax=Deinandra increscens subsp. villosa TaxID=3103831 RepID=A0AAP0HD22_9ASTR
MKLQLDAALACFISLICIQLIIACTDEITVPTKGRIDLELKEMRNMTLQEAAAAAAQAVAEAEVTIAEVEEASREAETAEADAEVAQAFAKAAMKTLKERTTQRW